ncbi:hypothetical protein MMC17_006827 [Xylographa soralifera]|nr:hypothetical protein [Xylographa soralifera]
MKLLRDCRAFIAKRLHAELQPKSPRGSTEAKGVHRSLSPPAYSVAEQCDVGRRRPEALAVRYGEKPMDAGEEVVDAVRVEELKEVLRVCCAQDYLLPAEFVFCHSTLEDWGLKPISSPVTSQQFRALGEEWIKAGKPGEDAKRNEEFQRVVIQPIKALGLEVCDTIARLIFPVDESYLLAALHYGCWGLLARAFVNDEKNFRILFDTVGLVGKRVDLYLAVSGRHAFLQNQYFDKLVSATEFVPSRIALEYHQREATNRLRRGSD